MQLTDNEWAWDKHPSWSPDGAQIILLSNRSGSQQWKNRTSASFWHAAVTKKRLRHVAVV